MKYKNIIDEDTSIDSFFKIIKLKLSYCENVTYVRLKMRTLLREFNYRIRKVVFVDKLKKSMERQGLVTYLKGHEECDIGKIKLDDMIMVRLK